MPFDLLIHNATVVTVNPAGDVLSRGFIAVKDGRIAAVASRPAKAPLPQARKVIDADGGLILPGLVNTHTHLPMSLFRGLADDLPLMTWLNDHIFPAEARFITRESVRLGALLACAEMLLSGTTTCCDGYFHADGVAEAVEEAGMRGVVGQGVIDFPAPGVPDPARNVEAAAAFVAAWKGRTPLIRPSIFCHSPYTCAAETIVRAKELADADGLLFQIHAAETREEVSRLQAEKNASSIGYLDRLGILGEKTLLVHAVWVDERDIAVVARQSAKISHNPQSNAKLAAGIAPAPRFLAAGLDVGLGTDGCASNNDLDLFQEMDFAAKLHKAGSADPTVLDAETVLRMATIDGARALGLAGETGSLEPGKEADIILVDTHAPHLAPLYHPHSHLVYAAGGGDVRHVWVAGRQLVRDRRILTFDVEQVMAAARSFSLKIAQKD